MTKAVKQSSNSGGLNLSATQDLSGDYSASTPPKGVVDVTSVDIGTTLTTMVNTTVPTIGAKPRPLSVFNLGLSSLTTGVALRTKITIDDRVLWDYTAACPAASAALQTVNASNELTRWRVEKYIKIEAYQAGETSAAATFNYQILED